MSDSLQEKEGYVGKEKKTYCREENSANLHRRQLDYCRVYGFGKIKSILLMKNFQSETFWKTYGKQRKRRIFFTSV